jgi:hypothetical protein
MMVRCQRCKRVKLDPETTACYGANLSVWGLPVQSSPEHPDLFSDGICPLCARAEELKLDAVEAALAAGPATVRAPNA